MMTRTGRLALSLSLLLLFAGAVVLVQDADARAGGGRSIGGSGSRSLAAPSRPSSRPITGAPGQPSSQPPVQPAGGGFLRSMGGGILGGLLGGMLFSSLGFGGTGGFGGSGIGFIEIMLICGIGYWIYTRMANKRREAGPAYQTASPRGAYQEERGHTVGAGSAEDQLRRMDPSLDEGQFKEMAMDIFFKVQGCWTNRDLSAGTGLLTDDIKRIFQHDIDQQIQAGRTNRLENIAVRKIEVVEAWQETGRDFVKAMLFANLLDYTTDDTTGAVIAGSRTEPVKFEEYWTYVRPIGSNFWKLTAIGQA